MEPLLGVSGVCRVLDFYSRVSITNRAYIYIRPELFLTSNGKGAPVLWLYNIPQQCFLWRAGELQRF